MEKKSLKFAAAFLTVLTAAVCALLPYLPGIYTREIEARENRMAEAEFAADQEDMQELAMREETVGAGERGQLYLRLPEGVDGGEVRISNDYVTQTVRIELPETESAYFDSYPIAGKSTYIDTLSYTRNGEESVIEIVTDRVYELDTEYDANYYYFNFLTPQEVYDKVVVIDAGHGGRVPGAIKQGIKEKDIDLAIVLELQKIFAESAGNIGVYYTRTDDSNPTFEQRVGLANKAEADLFISIHNNSFGSGRMSKTRGTQVMYDPESEESLRLARICMGEVTLALGSQNAGFVKGDVYIIRNSEVPVALIEVGFMTNQEELALLNTPEYQSRAAQGIYETILRAFAEGY